MTLSVYVPTCRYRLPYIFTTCLFALESVVLYTTTYRIVIYYIHVDGFVEN